MIVEILWNSVSLEFANELCLYLCECVCVAVAVCVCALPRQLPSANSDVDAALESHCQGMKEAMFLALQLQSELELELSLIRVQIINFQLLSETSRRRCNPNADCRLPTVGTDPFSAGSLTHCQLELPAFGMETRRLSYIVAAGPKQMQSLYNFIGINHRGWPTQSPLHLQPEKSCNSFHVD